MKKYAQSSPAGSPTTQSMLMHDKNAIYLLVFLPETWKSASKSKNISTANRLFIQTSANYDFLKILLSVHIKIYRHLPLIILHFLSHFFFLFRWCSSGGKLKINFNVCSFSSFMFFLRIGWKRKIWMEKGKTF